jgi:hypothetical protein
VAVRSLIVTAKTHAPLEDSLRAAVSTERLHGHLEVLSELHRHSGTDAEWQAARYVVETVRGYDVEAELLELDALISWPLAGTLKVLRADQGAAEEIPVRTRAFGAQTAPGGIEADLVYVPFAPVQSGAMIFAHRVAAGEYVGLDVAGRAVLTADGGPDGVRRAQERGAVAHLHIWPSDEDVIHEMIASGVWGTPTPESARDLPRIPAVGLTRADGERIAAMLAAGPLRVRIEANVETRWMRLPLAVATIPGAASADFLLLGAHIDSWYEGVTDNATGNAALIEMTRILAARAADLRCGARIAWWPGHSTGRYAGSTWYADTRFRELREHGLGYLNIDSPGVRETAIWDCRYTTGEVERLTAGVVRELSGREPTVRRPTRAADQSFLGIGLPSLGAYRMLPLDHPDRKAVGGCGGAFWWHTPLDTLDKADVEILADDTRVYLTLTARLCQPATIPYDFVPASQDFLDSLDPLQAIAGEHLDLRQTMRAAGDFRAAADRLARAPIADTERLNDGLKRISRLINPALFTINGPYEMDPALQLPVLPGLAPLRTLAGLDPASSAYHFLLTRLRRQRNRIEEALVAAAETARRLSA